MTFTGREVKGQSCILCQAKRLSGAAVLCPCRDPKKSLFPSAEAVGSLSETPRNQTPESGLSDGGNKKVLRYRDRKKRELIQLATPHQTTLHQKGPTLAKSPACAPRRGAGHGCLFVGSAGQGGAAEQTITAALWSTDLSELGVYKRDKCQN